MPNDDQQADPDVVADWLIHLLDRHTARLTRPEFLKAVRALSARYVERRAALADRPALDSAGKRAAFAAFYGPLHFLATRSVMRALGLGDRRIDILLDLGCGTGVTSAAWTLEARTPPHVWGIDRDTWALAEARWNWRQLGVHGRAVRADLVDVAQAAAAGRFGLGDIRRVGFVLGWSVNELTQTSRARLLESLRILAGRSAGVLVLEPISRAVAPWWPEWEQGLAACGGRADMWKFDSPLPASLAELDEAAGFRRSALGVRSLYCGPQA
jgi:hypothetical protein